MQQADMVQQQAQAQAEARAQAQEQQQQQQEEEEGSDVVDPYGEFAEQIKAFCDTFPEVDDVTLGLLMKGAPSVFTSPPAEVRVTTQHSTA